MPFLDTNVATGLPEGSAFQVGATDVDPGLLVERDIDMPFVSSAEASWVYFDCSIGAMLDSGIVVHNRLPQVNRAHDTLARTTLNSVDLDKLIEPGVNLRCQDQYKDIVQRMGHARYWFRIWGRALRIGYQIPIPGIKMIGGVPAIPHDNNPQWAYNSIVPGGNYGGAILWRAEWSLWYTTAEPPLGQQVAGNQIPAADPSAHISIATPTRRGTQSPYSQPDDSSVLSDAVGAARAASGVARGIRGIIGGNR